MIVLWNKLFGWRHKPRKARRVYRLDEEVLFTLQERAKLERRSEADLAVELIANGLVERQNSESYQERWQSLTPREQEVAALIARDLTYRQIGVHLNISEQTVRVHVRSALGKFGLHTKEELVRILQRWDFSEWNI